MTDVRTQTRRKTTLEVLSLVAPMATAVLLSSWWIVGWDLRAAAAATVLTAVVLAASQTWHRSRVPPVVEVVEEVDGSAGHTGVIEDEDDGRWDLFTVVLLVASVVVVVVVGLLVQFLLPLLVVLLFSLAHGSPGTGDVLATIGVMLAVSLVVEVAVVLPLARRWGLPIDD